MANTYFKVDNGILANGDSLFQANVTVNASANVVQNLTVGGDLTVNGNIAFSNVSVSGQMLPTANGVLLGNTVRRFTLSADNINFSNSVVVANGTSINIRAGDGIIANSTSISVNASSISNGVLNIGQGGTNAATREAGLNNLLPAQNTAVINYFLRTNGTTVEWVSGAGTQGPIGYTGSKGDLGYTGSRGPIGYTGSQGTAGTNGSIGPTGYTGSAGTSGAQGPIGYTGSQGTAGTNGSTGATGFTGSAGSTGSQGPIGYTGSQGYTGSVGTFSGSYTGNMAITGNITATGDITAYFSDDRLKTKLANLDNALDKLLSLNGFIFEPNDVALDLGVEMRRDVGISAQEVQRVQPEIVVPAPIHPDYLTVKYEKLIPLIVEAIKELSDIVKSLEDKINAD